VLPTLPLFSLDFGLAADVFFDQGSERVGNDRASEIRFDFRPALMLMASPKIEVPPFAVIGIEKESDSYVIATWYDIDTDFTTYFLGIGMGLNYHYIQSGIISVIEGPSLLAILHPEST
jgi:hypothetical protein